MRRSCKQSCRKLLLPPTQDSVRFMRLRRTCFHIDSQLNLQLIHTQHLNPCVNLALPNQSSVNFSLKPTDDQFIEESLMDFTTFFFQTHTQLTIQAEIW